MIYVHTYRGPHGQTRSAVWRGDPGWLSVPPAGATWFHCQEWTGETVERVSWNGPGHDTAHTIEIEVDSEVLDHLVADHDFQE